MSGRDLERALGVAEEYESLVARGDMPLAEAASKDIDDLVGEFRGGVWTLPACVWDRMRERTHRYPARTGRVDARTGRSVQS